MPILCFARALLRQIYPALLLVCTGSGCFAQLPSNKLAPQHPLLVGYFPQWGLYNQPMYLAKDLITPRGTLLLDQINYAQGFVIDGHCSVADPHADLQYSFAAT